MNAESEGVIDQDWVDQLRRPDRDLPPELRHEKIREVRDVSSSFQWAYQIVFDQHWLPYNYWNPKPEGWEMSYARAEYHNDFSGLLGWIVPNRECICIVVQQERDRDVF